MNKLFMDCEFTGLHQGTQLLSIGIISDDNKKFYFENLDFDRDKIYERDKEFLRGEVIPNTEYIRDRNVQKAYVDYLKRDTVVSLVDFGGVMQDDSEGKHKECFGDINSLKKYLVDWLNHFDDVEIWSDVYAYDWVLFNQIFGHAFDIPDNIYYIPFDIATYMKVKGVDPDVNREEFAKDYMYDSGYTMDITKKHNSLKDAIVIKGCYERLSKM